ncbi:hypothetical protein J3A83DRAFT_4248380 [Scleroderma citrinum]
MKFHCLGWRRGGVLCITVNVAVSACCGRIITLPSWRVQQALPRFRVQLAVLNGGVPVVLGVSISVMQCTEHTRVAVHAVGTKQGSYVGPVATGSIPIWTSHRDCHPPSWNLGSMWTCFQKKSQMRSQV